MAYYISAMEVAFSEVRMHNDIAFNGYYRVETICLTITILVSKWW